MKNIFANLSEQTNGILLMIGGFILVFNYFGIIQVLQSIIAGVGVFMIIMGAIMARLYQKISALFKKESNNQNQQPPQTF